MMKDKKITYDLKKLGCHYTKNRLSRDIGKLI